jgi:hypothetical protein
MRFYIKLVLVASIALLMGHRQVCGAFHEFWYLARAEMTNIVHSPALEERLIAEAQNELHAELDGTPPPVIPAASESLDAKLAPRGIGVNYYDCFYRLLTHGDRSYEKGFAALEEHHIPFARFMAGGYWASDMKLYQTDKAEYFHRLDVVVDSTTRHHVDLVPSLFWAYWTVPDLMGETCDQWGNPASKTHAFMRQYTREIVTRYKDSPAILAWEFGNEYNLATDLPDAASHRPPVSLEMGTPKSRSARDELTSDILTVAIEAFAREVRRIDERRMILSGNSIIRVSAAHQRSKRTWDRDSLEEQAERLIAENPRPCDAISVHLYTDDDLARLPELRKAAAADGRPLFIGEFGVSAKTPDAQKKFDAMLSIIATEQRFPFAALWVYDYPAQQGEWSDTFNNDRAYQLRAIEKINQTVAAPHPARRR